MGPDLTNRHGLRAHRDVVLTEIRQPRHGLFCGRQPGGGSHQIVLDEIANRIKPETVGPHLLEPVFSHIVQLLRD